MAETKTTPLVKNAAHDEHVPASAHFHRTVKRITVAILVVPVVALLGLLIGFFVIAVWPFRWVIGCPQVQFLILVRTHLSLAASHFITPNRYKRSVPLPTPLTSLFYSRSIPKTWA
jgi:hypothetical protein